MKCKAIMTKDPVCCVSTDTAMAAAEIMKSEDIGSLPVVDDKASKRLAGIVTDRDLALEVVAAGRDPKSVKIADVMKSGLVTCKTTDDVKKAIDKMSDHQIRRIPVVDEEGCIVGIIAQADVATRLEEPETTADMVEEISR